MNTPPEHVPQPEAGALSPATEIDGQGSGEQKVKIQIAGATITVSVGALLSFIMPLLERSPRELLSPELLILIGVAWLGFVIIRTQRTRSTQSRRTLDSLRNALTGFDASQLKGIGESVASQGEAIARLQLSVDSQGMVVQAYGDRAEWYRDIAHALLTAPNGATVIDTTCGPARSSRSTEALREARAEYRAAVQNRKDMHYRELYSSNWEPDIRHLLEEDPEASVRVIPCASPHYLFTDFMVIRKKGIDNPGHVFLSGLDFPGGEVNLWIKNQDVAEFFFRFFDLLQRSAYKAKLEDGNVMIAPENGAPVHLSSTTSCSDVY